MNILPNFLRSLLLTSLLSFAAPSLPIGFGLAGFSLLGHLPGFRTLGQSGVKHLLQFLSTFGSGRPLQGLLVIGLTCSLVGALFDAYAFCQYQNLGGDE
jgi:hypothetical protein